MLCGSHVKNRSILQRLRWCIGHLRSTALGLLPPSIFCHDVRVSCRVSNPNPTHVVHRRLALGVKGINVFTRSEHETIIKNSYKDVRVNVSTLRIEGNFKELVNGRDRNIPGMTKWRAFRLQRANQRIEVSVKEFMHSRDWTGPTADGVRRPDTPPHNFFLGPPPNLLGPIPPYKLNPVKETTIASIRQRYIASRERLPAVYPGGKNHLYRPSMHCEVSPPRVRFR